MRDLSEAPPRSLSDQAECKSPIETLVASLATGGSSLRGVDFSSLDNRRSGRQSRNVLTPVREMPSKAGDSSAASDVQNSSDANTTASTGGSSPTEDLDGLEAEVRIEVDSRSAGSTNQNTHAVFVGSARCASRVCVSIGKAFWTRSQEAGPFVDLVEFLLARLPAEAGLCGSFD
eukprot:scaffold529_cov308-Pinguiococcus_pyrenoidosus.AAC.42